MRHRYPKNGQATTPKQSAESPRRIRRSAQVSISGCNFRNWPEAATNAFQQSHYLSSAFRLQAAMSLDGCLIAAIDPKENLIIRTVGGGTCSEAG